MHRSAPSPRSTHRQRLVALHRRARLAPFALSGLALAWLPCGAQTAETLDAVVVTGKALSVKRTIAEKRAETVVSDGVSSDEIGSIPDFGLGEALQRVPGISMIINNGRGEAQFMTLRGFNPDYNMVLIDGIALPSTETTRRTVSLDVIPASMSRQVTVYKTFTSEMEGNAIGGITTLRTRSAFDKVGLQASGRADLSRWDNQRRFQDSGPSGQVEGTVSNTFGASNQFGALLSASYMRRDSSSLNTAIDSYSYFPAAASGTATTNASALRPASQSLDGSIAMPDRLRWLSYDNLRTRKGLLGKLEYDDQAHWRAHLTAGGFQHQNDEDRRAHWLQNNTSASSALTLSSAGSGSVASGQSQSDYAKFDQDRRVSYADLGVEYQPSADQVLDFSANRAKASYRQDAKLYTFVAANSPNLAYSYDYAAGSVPVFTPKQPSYLLSPANYNQTENTTQLETSGSTLSTLKLNFAQNMHEDAKAWGFKAGLHYRDLLQTYNFDETKFAPRTGVSIPLSAVGAAPFNVTPYNSNGRALLLPDPAAAEAYFLANPGSYAAAGTNTQNSTQRDFSIKEQISAGYAMAAYRATGWSGVLGLRAESTRQQIDTYIAAPANQTATYSPVSSQQRYSNLLPSANLSFDLRDDLRLRAAASQTLARPTYAQLGQNSSSVAGTVISQTRANPNLSPRESTNIDLSLEWYRSRDSMLSAALFRKAIRNEIASLTTPEASTIGGVNYTVNTTQAQNVGEARVVGLELGLMQTRFAGLPAPFDQFGGTFNLTLLDPTPSSITMGNGAQRQMPSLMESPKSVVNASLLWGYGPCNAQLSYNRTGKTLITLSTSSAAQDVFYKALGTLDAQFGYRLNQRLSLMLKAKNLANARPTRVTGPDQGLLNQEIDNGRALYIGASYAL